MANASLVSPNPAPGTFPLWDRPAPYYDSAHNQAAPSLEPFLAKTGPPPATSPAPAVLVFPGGGYANLAPHEGAPVAQMLNRLGVSAFVVRYRVAPYRHPVPLTDARRAVRMVRARAGEFGVDPTRIGVLGFSAGGHLCASLSTQPDADRDSAGLATGSSSHDGRHAAERSPAPANHDDQDRVDRESARPDFAILCYPVISFTAQGHSGSGDNLLGPNASEAEREGFSCDRLVTRETPPTFLWHTADDQAVPVAASLTYASALSVAGVSVSLHVFPTGRHGLGLAEGVPEVDRWPTLLGDWLSALCG
jgi:acetyl esterase/lipase